MFLSVYKDQVVICHELQKFVPGLCPNITRKLYQMITWH